MDSNQHTDSVKEISVAVARFHKTMKPFRIYHGSTNSTRTLTFKRDEMLDTSMLDKVLSIDAAARKATVEPNVPMDRLVRATLAHGLVPPVVPEFPGITVGGAIQGGAGESSSFKRGFFSQNVNWCEMVLGDGTIVRCSKDERSDLFHGAAGSMGSLGVITAAEIQLVPAKKYVRLEYIPVDGFASAISELQSQSKQPIDFLDAILFSRDSGVVITGSLSDETVGRTRHFRRARDEWFYRHAESMSRLRQEHVETVPLQDYLFRYDRGAFWVGRYAFERFKVPYNRVTRCLLDPILHTRKLYQALQDSGASQEHIVQDLSVPLAAAVPFLKYVHDEFAIYPLWLCPLLPAPQSPLLCNALASDLVINIGVWGPRIENYERFVQANRLLESRLIKTNGKKWLYAHTYYTEREFWKIYDKSAYDTLRVKYRAALLPDIYSKTKVHGRVEVDAKRALVRTIFGQARLRIRD